MEWRHYIGIVRRRWSIIAVVLLVDLLAASYLFARAYRHVGYQACLTLYVADVGAPGVITAPPTSLQAEGQLLAGETAANFFGDDILDVAQSRSVAEYVAGHLAPQRLANTSFADVNGAVSGSRLDRTDSICVTNPSQASALAVDAGVGQAMTSGRARFLGRPIARRTFVQVVSPPSANKVSTRHDVLSFLERLVFGLILAAGLALLWDGLDPMVRDERDVEQAVGAPVLAAWRA